MRLGFSSVWAHRQMVTRPIHQQMSQKKRGADIRIRELGSNVDDSIQRNRQYTLFSWTKQSGLDPLLIRTAKGVKLYDFEGKSYLDLSSQLMNVNVGHRHPYVVEALKDQLDRLPYVQPKFATEERGRLGERLAQKAPGALTKTLFTNGGSDAIENAIKLARLVTGKSIVVARARSYHGATSSALGLSGDPRKMTGVSMAAPGFVQANDPFCYRSSWDSPLPSVAEYETYMERLILSIGPQHVAAVVMEGVSGSSGCVPFPVECWGVLRRLADRYNFLLISDEVMSGFGRCGYLFAAERGQVELDMVTMAKGLTSAYVPMGGVMVSDRIAAYFDEHELSTGLTYSSHSLGCAAANACLDVYEREGLFDRALHMGDYLTKQLHTIKAKHESVVAVRNVGLLGCLEVSLSPNDRPPLVPWIMSDPLSMVMQRISQFLRDHGVQTYIRWNIIFVAPPLVISSEELDDGLAIISQALSIADEQVQSGNKRV